MQYTTVLLSLLAATGALAAPTKRTSDSIEVRLAAQTFFLHVPMAASQRQEKRLGERFTTVEWKTIQILAQGAAKPRCSVTDLEGKEIIATRGANRDTTFSDGGKAEWTFDAPTGILDIVCDPAFEANNLNVNNFAGPTATDSSAAAATDAPPALI